MERIILGLALIGMSLSACTSQHNAVVPAPVQQTRIDLPITLPPLERGARPEWMGDDSAMYPAQDFIALKARGESVEAAAQAAYQAMVELLHPLPEAASIETLRPRIQIGGLWFDQGHYHALAVFPRVMAARHLRDQLETLDAATREDVARLENGAHTFSQIGLLHGLIQRQQLRAVYQKSLKRADPTGEGRESPWNTLKWSQQLDDLLARLSVAPTTGQDSTGREALQSMLQAGLIKAGIRADDPGHAARMEGRLRIDYQSDANGWVQAHGRLELSVDAGVTASARKGWDLRATALDAAGAERRIMAQSRRLLEENMRQLIIELASEPVASIHPNPK